MASPDQSSPLQLFVSLPIPAPVKAEVEKLQNELRQGLPADAVRWLRMDQFHLTLRFLGNVDADQTESLITAIGKACSTFKPLQLRTAELGFFPDERRPRILWAGIAGDTDALRALQQAIAAATAAFAKQPEDHPFTAHLTLARLKNIRPHETRLLAERVRKMSGRLLGEWTADRVELMHSELRPDGSRYSCLAELPLSLGN